MKIEKKGNLYPTVRFTCWQCGCVFTARKDEYIMKQGLDLVIEYHAKCPNSECRANVITLKKD